MTEARTKQATRFKAVTSTRKKIANLQAENLGDDVVLRIPFVAASKQNQDAHLRTEQNLLRKQLSTYLGENFGRFVTAMNAITDAELFVRLYLDAFKLFVPRFRNSDTETDEELRKNFLEMFFCKADRSIS